MLFTALLGWLSIQSILFYAWRSTYHNWRSVFAAPADPLAWGAMSAGELNEMLHAYAAQDGPGATAPDIDITDTPLASLSESQLSAIANAEGLYELLNVRPGASREEIRRAYRQEAMKVHPDLAEETTSDENDRMIRLNQAWEILGDPDLRLAYDWIQDYDG